MNETLNIAKTIRFEIFLPENSSLKQFASLLTPCLVIDLPCRLHLVSHFFGSVKKLTGIGKSSVWVHWSFVWERYGFLEQGGRVLASRCCHAKQHDQKNKTTQKQNAKLAIPSPVAVSSRDTRHAHQRRTTGGQLGTTPRRRLAWTSDPRHSPLGRGDRPLHDFDRSQPVVRAAAAPLPRVFTDHNRSSAFGRRPCTFRISVSRLLPCQMRTSRASQTPGT